jgi:hypothetical protein
MQPRQPDLHDEDQLCGAGAERGFAGGDTFAGAPCDPPGGSDGSRQTNADERGVFGDGSPGYASAFAGRVDALPMRSGRPDQGFGGSQFGGRAGGEFRGGAYGEGDWPGVGTHGGHPYGGENTGGTSGWGGDPEGGYVHQRHDSDYQRWRAEQLRGLDDDYRRWHDERRQRQFDEFCRWREQRTRGGGG